jgi:TPR repeat protein
LNFLAIWGLIGRWFSVPLRPKAYLLAARLLKFTRILISPQQGRGGAQDEAEAVRWYRKAAEQGDGEAQDALGV